MAVLRVDDRDFVAPRVDREQARTVWSSDQRTLCAVGERQDAARAADGGHALAREGAVRGTRKDGDRIRAHQVVIQDIDVARGSVFLGGHAGRAGAEQ